MKYFQKKLSQCWNTSSLLLRPSDTDSIPHSLVSSKHRISCKKAEAFDLEYPDILANRNKRRSFDIVQSYPTFKGECKFVRPVLEIMQEYSNEKHTPLFWARISCLLNVIYSVWLYHKLLSYWFHFKSHQSWMKVKVVKLCQNFWLRNKTENPSKDALGKTDQRLD